jgi:galactose-1-phosphate uridylyltransferase
VEFHGKTTVEAGYEQHTGEFVNPTCPEEIAEQLREIASVHLK